jgi:hypothetical protein
VLSREGQRRVFDILLPLAAFAAIVPLFLARHLPMADLPEHLAATATLRHWGDPAWANQQYFTLQGVGETPYWLYHLAAALLSVVTGSAERANLALLAAVGLAYPYALRSLLRALQRDERLAIFGCALFWTQNLTVGLLNFVASVPLVLYGLSLVVRQAEQPSIRRGVGVSAISVLILYLHLNAFALFVAQGVLLTWWFPVPAQASSAWRELRSRIRRLPLRLSWLVPAAACALVIARAGRAGATSGHEHGFVFTPRLELLRMLHAWMFDCFRSRVDDILGAGLIATLFVLLAMSSRSASFEERWRSLGARLVFGVALVTYFVMPKSVGAYAFLLDVRMAIFVALFALLLPTPRVGMMGTAPLAFGFVFAILLSINVGHEVRAFETEEVGNFDELLQQMPHGRRLLQLNFEPRSAHVNANPFGFFGSYYRARYGGVASFSFNEIPHWPIQYRPEHRPPGAERGVAWNNPCDFRNSTDGAYFDFLLVHGERDPIADGPPGPTWELVGKSRAFHLYQRNDVQTRPGEPDHSLCM